MWSRLHFYGLFATFAAVPHCKLEWEERAEGMPQPGCLLPWNFLHLQTCTLLLDSASLGLILCWNVTSMAPAPVTDSPCCPLQLREPRFFGHSAPPDSHQNGLLSSAYTILKHFWFQAPSSSAFLLQNTTQKPRTMVGFVSRSSTSQYHSPALFFSLLWPNTWPKKRDLRMKGLL